MIELQEVGAHVSVSPAGVQQVTLGIYLPRIRPADGYEVVARIIHRDDRFDPLVQPQDFSLTWHPGTAYDLWSGTIELTPAANSHFGTSGTYLYRYQLLRTVAGSRKVVTRWFTDPFARATEIGLLSSFSTSDTLVPFAWRDAGHSVPNLDDLVVYELNVEEFNGSFQGVKERLVYLKSLGVNVIELMPVTSLKLDFDWGYGPIHYYAPHSALGGVQGLKDLVNECHVAGISVILDVVFQHVDEPFPYKRVYDDAGLVSPMIGRQSSFGFTIDYSSTFAQDYITAVTAYFLDEYHVDGFRYDEVDDYYFGATDPAYANLSYKTYLHSLPMARFQTTAGYSKIIQCAEALGKGKEVLRNTFTNCVWQDNLLNKSENMAQYRYANDEFFHILDTRFSGYPDTKSVTDIRGNPVDMPVAPFQYLETHDHSQLISFIAQENPGSDVPVGKRSEYFRLQPFVIALYTCQGIPMLWEGQEFADNWTLPASGNLRISFRRNVHWEYFYDEPGGALIRLYRIMAKLRSSQSALKSRESFYFNQQSRANDRVFCYLRSAPAVGGQAAQFAMVFLNFSDSPQGIWVPFPAAGQYVEMIDDTQRQASGVDRYIINVGASNEFHEIQVPSNYGCVFIRT